MKGLIMALLRKHRIWIVSTAVLLVISVLAALVVSSHYTMISELLFIRSAPDRKVYNDWWVVGNSIENVREKYGDFSRMKYGAFNGDYGENGGTVGYYIGKEANFLDPTGAPMYYWMHYNSDRIVTEVYIQTLPGG